LNILIVSQYYWPENFRITDLAEEMVSRGHQVCVTTGLPNYPEGKLYGGYKWKIVREEHNGVHIIRSPVITRGNGSNIRLFMNYLSFAIISSVVTPLKLKNKVDVVFVFGVSPVTSAIPAIVLKKLIKKPVLFWVLDLWPDSVFVNDRLRSSMLKNIISKLTSFINRSCDKLLVQSKGFYAPIVKSGVDSENIYYVPSWAETIFFDINKEKLHSKDSVELEKRFYITFAGNIGAGQDIECIVEAIKKLLKVNTSIHWLFIGEGSRYEWLERNVEKYGLGGVVHLIGRQPLNSMPYYFHISSVLIASLRDEYIYSLTIPGKIQSYLASGKPIISVINGETCRVVTESKSGIAVSSGDVDGLVEAAIELFSMSENDRNELGKNGKKYYKKMFERSMVITQIERIMQDSITNNK